jgi:hypothetical protein
VPHLHFIATFELDIQPGLATPEEPGQE